ncbi:hypothetical protein PIROE2DRAFT_64759 [Piromyces sp. E2]|nr:hypothetical protein PIROE2DRAFT_64759 [Piromyces sp. E2]|eukprot:OUM57869.1 hypothetical protein PIROE2DRAFT_64759 [Piromyces sp. E2]
MGFEQEISLIVQGLSLGDNAAYTKDDISQILLKEHDKFIYPGTNPSYPKWVLSKGTNITCYASYLAGISKEQDVGNTIDVVRTIIYACAKPLQSQFFYWTLLLLILHKFNFKKPVMKIILAHYVLRAIGDILDQLSGLMSHYYTSDGNGNCKNGVDAAEQHPLRWLLTRQIGCIFWYLGEICGDWYPLLRTRAVARDQRSMIWVYVTCGLFNLSKIVLLFIQFIFLPASKLYKQDKTGGYVYDNDKKNEYYNIYWGNIGVIILCSLMYDVTVFFVLKKQIFSRTKNEFGFLKKFRTISEYRIIVSVLICCFLLPVVLVTIAMKYYYYYSNGMKELNFSFEDIRTLIVNVQYFMIFIDQIMLFRSKDDSSMGETTSMTNTGGGYNSNNFSSNNSNQFIKPYNIDSKLYYSNLNTLNNNIQNSAQSNLMQYNYSTNANNNNNMNYGRNNSYSTRNNTIANYDDYNGTTNEWNYLRR